jgi:hypothetical protein
MEIVSMQNRISNKTAANQIWNGSIIIYRDYKRIILERDIRGLIILGLFHFSRSISFYNHNHFHL